MADLFGHATVKPGKVGMAEAQARFLGRGQEAVSDAELLDLAMGAAGAGAPLIEAFGSFAETVTAPAERLAELGVSAKRIARIKVAEAAASRIAYAKIAKREVLSSWNAVLDYCRARLAFADHEEFHLIFLDKRNQLIAAEKQQQGTVDHTPVYPREVIKRALQLNATAVILVHNHPSGDPTPSRADIQMTQAIVEVAKPLGIAVHDHLIIGRDGHASMKGLKLI